MTAIIVHKGEKYPPYLTDCIEQFFLFNNIVPLFLLVDQDFKELNPIKAANKNFNVVLISSLKKTFNHRFFLALNRLTKSIWRGGFWRYVVERFFVLEDFMTQHNITDVLHFEYDNMIYTDLVALKDSFQKIGKIALPADSDARCIPSIIYIPNSNFIKKYNAFYNRHYTLFPTNDMKAFSAFRKNKPQLCTTLPVIPREYTDSKKELTSLEGFTAKNNSDYHNFYENFSGIFDAAAFGQFLGGIDDRNNDTGKETKGFINKEAVYDITDFTIIWEEKNSVLKFPCITYKAAVNIPLFNLHIHSKKLHEFRSDID